jgi:hypothetical protein
VFSLAAELGDAESDNDYHQFAIPIYIGYKINYNSQFQ